MPIKYPCSVCQYLGHKIIELFSVISATSGHTLNVPLLYLLPIMLYLNAMNPGSVHHVLQYYFLSIISQITLIFTLPYLTFILSLISFLPWTPINVPCGCNNYNNDMWYITICPIHRLREFSSTDPHSNYPLELPVWNLQNLEKCFHYTQCSL